jgi:hypothetical protein
VRAEDKMAADLQMATLLFYHSHIFSLIIMRAGAEDQELGSLSCFLLAGDTVWGKIPVEALIAVLWTFWRGSYSWMYNWFNF